MKENVRKSSRILVIALIVLSMVAGSHIAFAKQTKADRDEYASALLMDYETGQILFEENAHKPVIPASIVKMMVLLLVMEKIEAGEMHLSDRVTVSAWASKIGGHQVYLREGETFPLEELLKAIAISSANDAATAVAEFLAGDPDACVKLMNARAKELGMNETIFANVHGLPPDKGQEENSTTAYDVALLGRELLKYPQILSWTSMLEAPFRNGTFTLTNTNRQLIRKYQGVDGLKTGFHSRGAGFNICATAKRNDRRLIVAVMGTSAKVDRYHAVINLLNVGFNQFEKVVVVQKGFPVGTPIPVVNGKTRTATAIAADTGVVLVEKGQQPAITQAVQWSVTSVTAPARRGTKLGEVRISVGEKTITRVDLVLDEDLPEGNLVDRLKHWIADKVS